MVTYKLEHIVYLRHDHQFYKSRSLDHLAISYYDNYFFLLYKIMSYTWYKCNDSMCTTCPPLYKCNPSSKKCEQCSFDKDLGCTKGLCDPNPCRTPSPTTPPPTPVPENNQSTRIILIVTISSVLIIIISWIVYLFFANGRL